MADPSVSEPEPNKALGFDKCFGARQDPLSPTDAEALMAVVLSSSNHPGDPDDRSKSREFWLVWAVLWISSGFRSRIFRINHGNIQER